MNIQADKFLALTALLAGFMPACTISIGPDTGDSNSNSNGNGDTTAGEGTTAAGPTTSGGTVAGTSSEGGTETTNVGPITTGGESTTDVGPTSGVTTGGTTGSGTTGAEESPCCSEQPTAGCAADPEIEACVCAEDPFCCDVEYTWDQYCIDVIGFYGCGVCDDDGGSTSDSTTEF